MGVLTPHPNCRPVLTPVLPAAAEIEEIPTIDEEDRCHIVIDDTNVACCGAREEVCFWEGPAWNGSEACPACGRLVCEECIQREGFGERPSPSRRDLPHGL